MHLKASQAIVEMLKQYGVKHVFGVPGDTGLALYEAFRQAGREIEHVLARDERSASFMADAYARVSFRPGVCEGPSGAGATYLAPGVAEANASSIPLIALTTDTPLSGEGRNVLTALDQQALFAPITKWCTVVKQADRVPDIMRKAFRVATSGRPGAVQITLPMDILDEEVEAPLLHAEEACHTYPSYRTRPDPAAVQKAAERLLQAESPVIVAGGGAVTSQAWPEITALAEALDIPVGTSITGKGSISEAHPLSLGVVGSNGSRTYGNAVLESADLILYIGCKTDSVTTVNWTLPPLSTNKTILHVDIDPIEISNNYPTAVGLAGDAKLAVADLLQAVQKKPKSSSHPKQSPLERIADQMAAWWKEFDEKARVESTPIKPQRVIKELAEALPADSIIIADAGTPTPFTAAYLRSQSGRRVIIPRGYGGLGYAIPAVLGAKLAAPQSTVVGLMGDGSFGMSSNELETLGRLGMPVTLLQFNNSCFGWIKVSQKLYHKGQYHCVDFSSDTDHTAIARGFGLQGVRVEYPQDLREAIREALASQQPTFIDIITESEVTELPPVEKWRRMIVESAQ
jgi:acetolactate synthase-1/2/3 large subunit